MAVSLLEVHRGLDRPKFLSLYHAIRVSAGGPLPPSDWAASQLFPSLSRARAEWKAEHFSELSEITKIIVRAIKNGQISVYKKENEDAAVTEINTRVFLNENVEVMPCLEDIKSGAITCRNIHFMTDEILSIFVEKKSGIRANPEKRQTGDRKRPGKAPTKREDAKQAMLQALKAGQSIESLRKQTEMSLADQYGYNRETVRYAREAALKEYQQK